MLEQTAHLMKFLESCVSLIVQMEKLPAISKNNLLIFSKKNQLLAEKNDS